MSRLGSERHGALIDEVVSFYAEDERILAVAVFGSVGAGIWHELSDLDLDVVIVASTRATPKTPSPGCSPTRARPTTSGMRARPF